MIFWPRHDFETYEREPVMKLYDESILSYKNVSVKISLISSDNPIPFQSRYDTIKAVVSYMQSYQP
ncbi:hypothetical protein ACFQWB_02010 [Paenibacillus thermoaerophilus]|uniref:Uncharacterized protein n=1 Tax=Paenibacillus thermoaerophilus TaxID=1215385 RepID=A0ABW2V097_9BACL|nr:hypothetical protein [Paenibacillus thermoaerophilus]TMV19122.1 hypothetical protein FE781_01020 [Paenibacillus thermoaerophilus]